MKTVNDAAAKGVSAIYFAEQFPGPERHGPYCEEMKDMKWYDARGNLSFMTNDDTLAESVMKWSNGEHMYEPPKCIDDLQDADEAKGLVDVISDAHETSLANTAFAGEMEAEIQDEKESRPFDEIVDDEDIGNDTAELLVQEREMMEEMPLPGRSQDERERKAEWLKLPRPARAAIRRLHNQFGHKPKEPLIEILKAAKCPEEYIRAAKYFRCTDCDLNAKLPKQTQKAAMPQPYVFNKTVGVDVNYLTDAEWHDLHVHEPSMYRYRIPD